MIRSVKPNPGSKTRDRTPTIRAVVRDRQTNLAKRNIRLSINGRSHGRFAYNRRTDRLTYTTPRLKPGRQTVRIVARDAQGRRDVETYRFTVKRR